MDHKDLEIVRFMLELERLKVWGNLSHYGCLCASLSHKGAKFNPKLTLTAPPSKNGRGLELIPYGAFFSTRSQTCMGSFFFPCLLTMGPRLLGIKLF